MLGLDPSDFSYIKTDSAPYTTKMQVSNMSFFLGFALLLFSSAILFFSVEGKIHYHDFYLREKNYTRLCETKKMLVVNDQFPGPTIYVQKGDTVFVNVYNQGGYGVTIHWHGVKQPRNPWSDGPEYVTQCPIQPGANFTYEVIFSDEEGTLWWHAHSDWTRNTVHGAIVIYPGEDTNYPYPKPDGEQIVILGSWYTYDVNLLVEENLSIGVDLPISDAYTINGQPGDFCNCSQEGTFRWEIEYNKTYLLRIINAVMNAEMFFSIARHNMTVVGTDGAYLKPFDSCYIAIGPGQTMDVLVIANQSLGQYYMAARQYYTDKLSFDAYDKTNVTAILQYSGNYTPPASPYFPTTTLPPYAEYNAGISFRNNFRSLKPQNVPNNITTRMFMTASQNENMFNRSGTVIISMSASLNNISFVNPYVDVLQAYYYNISEFYTEDFPDMPPTMFDFVSDDLGVNTTQSMMATKVRVLEFGEEVEIVVQTTNVMDSSLDHPMHLHGYSFYMVGAGGGNYDFVEDPTTYNLADPPSLNTAIAPKNGWVAVRFKANNPGVWLWHCHLERHYTWGMNTVFIVKNGGTSETSIKEPPPNMPECQKPPVIRSMESDNPALTSRN